MDKIKNILTHGLTRKVLIAVFVLAAVDMFSMAAPYYLKYVIPHVYTYLNISQAEFDSLNATLGWVVLGCQLPSGWLADKLSGRRLLIISVLMSGIFTLMFGLATQGVYGDSSLSMLYIIFIGFGVSTTLFLWSPLWKVLSQQGNDKEQGSLYGLQGSYNGFLGLIFITLIGTIATHLAKSGNNVMFYVLVYTIAGALFVSAWGTWKFIPETFEKSALLLFVKRIFKGEKTNNVKTESMWSNIIQLLKPLTHIRVWLTAFFVLGMYMFQSIFAYYLKSYLAIISTATVVAFFAGLRTYGLRLIVSGPFGAWLNKRRSWVLVMVFCLLLGMIIATLMILLAGVGNNITATSSDSYLMALKIIFPILFVLVGIFSWFLVAGRYAQISEIPHTKHDLGTVIAIISFIAFSSDAWFYQMAASWMKSSGHVMTAVDVKELGYGAVGGYDQAGIQMLLFVALGIAGGAMICGATVFMINKHEIKKMNKSSYRWRDEQVQKVAE